MTLLVQLPPAHTARLRFTAIKSDIESELIRAKIGGEFSHVEAVLDSSSGGTIVAAQPYDPWHGTAGVQNYRLDYDSWSTYQAYVDMPMTKEMHGRWCEALWSQIGKPFDSMAFIGEALGDVINTHEKGHIMCSALQYWAMNECGWWLSRRVDPTGVDPQQIWLTTWADPRCKHHQPYGEL